MTVFRLYHLFKGRGVDPEKFGVVRMRISQALVPANFNRVPAGMQKAGHKARDYVYTRNRRP